MINDAALVETPAACAWIPGMPYIWTLAQAYQFPDKATCLSEGKYPM